MKRKLVFNRVQGLKYLYENFPEFYNRDRILMYFVDSKKGLLDLKIDGSFDTFVLKRSSNKEFVSDIKFKDNRFFDNLSDLKIGSEEFRDVFDFCVECHKFKVGEDYYSDRLCIAQFSTKLVTDMCDRVNFIPSITKGVNTRENMPYLEVEFMNNYGSIYRIVSCDYELLHANNFDNYSIAYVLRSVHDMIDKIREDLLLNQNYDDFQLIIRIDTYLNLLPIDFRTPNAWAKIGG